jgi:hypothetical protein
VAAPAAAATAEGAIMAFAAQLGFEQGGIVPADQMAMVHQDEMVLPQNISKGMQEMLRNYSEGSGLGGARDGDLHVHVPSMDAKSFERFVTSQSSRNAISKAMNTARSRGTRDQR